ncbi:hypothetical protein [Actibacterium sp. 188UL27-1]|uniref:hypothetical protein n=1 Tax=Actibacterium sp. 188UL27-1 TaxID=2786961 RepID=UPI00195B07CF|nr:hypothetical protein [Actibacterium sp. 188UL27-1]MBM7068955.1 hypothetical protein [Actibacterium sp. 188UL27-1]
MKVLHTKVAQAYWERDFGRVEARVHLLVQEYPGARPSGKSLMVSVPAKAPLAEGSLRDRLHQEAHQMAQLFHRAEEGYRAAISDQSPVRFDPVAASG